MNAMRYRIGQGDTVSKESSGWVGGVRSWDARRAAFMTTIAQSDSRVAVINSLVSVSIRFAGLSLDDYLLISYILQVAQAAAGSDIYAMHSSFISEITERIPQSIQTLKSWTLFMFFRKERCI